MFELTQTDTAIGNCWQTAVACVLELDPESLPSQVEADTERFDAKGEKIWSPGFNNPLNAYLRDHHGLLYTEVYDYQIPAFNVKDPGWHMLIGPTVRTERHGKQHVVVGRYGQMVWDPHPSRAGLLSVEKWGVLVPFPERFRGTWNDIRCVCPACATAAGST